MLERTKFIKAAIFLRCSNDKHQTNCLKLRDALLDNFNEVDEAKVITKVKGDIDYCVYGIATINSRKKSSFTKALKNMPDDKNKPFVQELEVHYNK